MAEFTPDEIVKALRCCGQHDYNECYRCPFRGKYSFNDCAFELYLKAAHAIEELQKVLDAVNDAHNEGYDVGYWAGRRDYEPRWIPVTERLPEDRQSVLVHRDDGGIFIFEYFTTSPTDECWIDDLLNAYSTYSVTHWMPLPSTDGLNET